MSQSEIDSAFLPTCFRSHDWTCSLPWLLEAYKAFRLARSCRASTSFCPLRAGSLNLWHTWKKMRCFDLAAPATKIVTHYLLIMRDHRVPNFSEAAVFYRTALVYAKQMNWSQSKAVKSVVAASGKFSQIDTYVILGCLILMVIGYFIRFWTNKNFKLSNSHRFFLKSNRSLCIGRPFFSFTSWSIERSWFGDSCVECSH